MKRAVIVISLLSLTLLTYFYFSFNSKTPVDSAHIPEIKHISLYHYFSGSLSGGVTDTINIINSSSPQPKIISHALDHEAFKSMIVSTLAKGDPPELFTYWAGAKTQALADSQQIEPLDDLWIQFDLKNLLLPSLTSSATVYNGRNYLLPLDQHIVVFFYNTHIFKQLGLSPPVNYQQLIAAADTIKAKGLTPFSLGALERWPAQFWFDYLLLRSAGPEYRHQLMSGKSSYLDSEVQYSYSQWAELLKKGYFNDDANNIDWASATQQICSGEAAMTLMGTWAIQLFNSNLCNFKEGVDFDFFVFPVMDSTLPDVSVGPVDGLVLTRDSVRKDQAKRILHLFLEQDAQQAFSRGSGAFAVSRSVPKTFYSPFKQKLLNIITTTDVWAFNYDLATPHDVAEAGMDSFNELIAFPDQYMAILTHLDNQAKVLFATKPGSDP